MGCIPVNNATVLELSQLLGLPPIVVTAKISLFQEANKTEDFPTLEQIKEIGSSKPTSLSQVKKDLGLTKKEFSSLQRNMRNKKLGAYNAKNGSSYFIQWARVGQADLYTWEIIDKSRSSSTKKESLTTQPTLFQLEGNLSSPINQLDVLLKDFLTKAGVHVEEVYTTLENDAIAVYDLFSQVIKVSKEKANKNTLPEETGHVIIEGLGENHPLVKNLLDQIKQFPNWKQLLSSEYLETYENDELALIKELAGQFVGAEIVNKFKEKHPTVKGTISRIINKIIDKFLSLFNLIPQKSIDSLDLQIKELSSELAAKAFAEPDFIVNEGKQGKFYSLGKKTKRKDIKELKREAKPKEQKKTEIILARYKRQLKQLENKQGRLEEHKEEAKRVKDLIEAFELTNNIAYVQELVNKDLELVESYLDHPETLKYLPNTVADIRTVLDTFKDWEGYEQRVNELYKRFIPFLQQFTLDAANTYTNQEVDMEDVLTPTKDIGTYQRNIGALADVGDLLGQTVASIIKIAQNQISRKKTENFNEIDPEIKALRDYQTSQGVAEKDIYDIFVQEYPSKRVGKTLTFIRPFTSEYYSQRSIAFAKLGSQDADIKKEGHHWLTINNRFNAETEKWEGTPKWYNPNYEKIQNTPELKRFYDFYKDRLKKDINKLPINSEVYENFIPNKKADWLETITKSGKGPLTLLKDFISGIGTNVPLDESAESFMYDEEFAQDKLPLKFLASTRADLKSKDLGNLLLEFTNFADQYEIMEEVLPKVRIIQDVIANKSYINSHGKKEISGKDTNIFKLINDYVTVQIKGETRKKQGKISLPFTFTDSEGEQHTKEVYASDIVDGLLSYNSMLRIGLNPMNAFNNAAWGELSNRMEALGGRYFTNANLNKSEVIFWQQAYNENSKFNNILRLLEPLQEMEDYQLLGKNKIGSKWRRVASTDTLYKLQKGGEFWLQTRTMVASLLHDKIETKDGERISLWEAFDDNGKWNEEKTGIKLDNNEIDKISNKIQGINQVIHGRYSERDAAALNQYVLYRAAAQFRKWIPTALEQRFASYRFNDRLNTETEGRYITVFAHLIPELTKGTFGNGKYRTWGQLLSELWKTRVDIQSGKIFSELELYNVRKQITETLILAIILGSGILLFGGDDDKKKKHPSAFLKFYLEQTNRLLGDVLNFYNPSFYTNLGKNVLPITKTIDDLLKVLYYVPYLFEEKPGLWLGKGKATISKGEKKGENKEIDAILSMIPAINQAQATKRLFNKQGHLNSNTPSFLK